MPGLLKKLFNFQRTQRCPNCDTPIDAEAINLQEGVALCPDCGQLTRLAELNLCARAETEILAQQPSGVQIDSTPQTLRIWVTQRSLGGFVVAGLFAAFWNGIVGIFVLHAIAGICFNLFGPLPDWFPAAGAKHGVPMINDEPMTWGPTMFLCLFLIPFVVIGLGMAFVALFNLIGSSVIQLEESGSWVATGIWRLRWWKRFDPRHVSGIFFQRSKSEDSRGNTIEIVADDTVEFGTYLSKQRAEWLYVVLKNLLLQRPIQHPIPEIMPLVWLQRRA